MRCTECGFNTHELDIYQMLTLPDDFHERKRWQVNSEHRKTLEFYAWFINSHNQARILDLGAGPGTVAIPLSRLESVDEVVCFDKDIKALETLKDLAIQHGIAKVRTESNGNPWNLSFENETFDIIVCRYAMHHFPDRVGTIREIRRCLKPGGILLYSDPVMPDHSRDATHGLMTVRERSFAGYLTFTEMMDLINDQGLDILDSRPYYYQRGTLADYMDGVELSLKEELIRAWMELDSRTKRELKWTGNPDGAFITYPMLDIAATLAAN